MKTLEKISDDFIKWCILAFFIFALVNIGAILGTKQRESEVIAACIKDGHYYTPKYNLVCTPLLRN